MTRIFEVENLQTSFPVRSGLLRRHVGDIYAVNGVSIHLDERETLGIVGESGCGKTTLARSVLRLIEPTGGRVTYRGENVLAADRQRLRELRGELQIVFQDPFASLNPRMSIADIVAEPLRVRGLRRADIGRTVADTLQAVGLLPEHSRRYPHEFSGGQRQRIGIARALAVRPKVVVLDEPVSALDVSVQAQVLNLLNCLQDEFDVSFLFIAHDLSVVQHISDRISVMYLGKIVESADTETISDRAAHPYSLALLSAIPVPNPDHERRRRRIILRGDLPSPANPPSGCAFRTRCPLATDLCAQQEPPLVEIAPGHDVACHFPVAVGDTLVDRIGQLGANAR